MGTIRFCPKRTGEGRCCYHVTDSSWSPGQVVYQETCCWCDHHKETVQKLEKLAEVPHGPYLKSQKRGNAKGAE